MKRLIPFFVLLTLLAFGLFLVVSYVYLADKYCPLEAETHASNLWNYGNEGKADASRRHGRDTQGQNDQAEIVAPLLQLVAAETEQPNGAGDTKNKAKKSHRWIVKFFCEAKAADAALVFFTYGLMIVTGWLAWATLKLWDASEKQAQLTKDALLAEQRGWIMISVEIESLRFLDRGGSSPDPIAILRVHVSNVGRTPAINMRLHLAIYTDHGYSEFQLRAFAALNEDSPDEGRFVSPREEFVIETNAIGNGGELYQYGGRGNYPMLLLGCVTYHVIQDGDAPKQTGFAYRFEAIDDDLRIFPSQGDLNANQVRLVPAGGGFVT